MTKKHQSTLVIGIVALVIILVVGAAYLQYHQSRPLVVNNPSAPKYPSVMGTLLASTGSGITLTLQDKTQKTFAVSTSTEVVTQVKSGEVGKSLSDIAVGTMVLVLPSNADKNTARRVSILSAPAAGIATPAGPPATLTGTLLATTADSITISIDGQPSLHVAITKNTVVLSNVMAGQRGLSLEDATVGMRIQVFGSAGTGGFTASSIQLLVPLP